MAMTSTVASKSLAEQKAVWRRQVGSIPGLLGGKSAWLAIVVELVSQIGDRTVVDLDSRPEPLIEEQATTRRGGAARREGMGTWREYQGFLRALRLVDVEARELTLSVVGRQLLSDPTPSRLAEILADRIRLFAEVLSLIAIEPSTIEEIDDLVRARYHTSWKSTASLRTRTDWLEVLGLIEPAGNRRWTISSAGELFIQSRQIISPEAIAVELDRDRGITKAPIEVASLLEELSTNKRSHLSRSTYNIWVPSPPSNPNKVSNLRIIVNAALDKIERAELFEFICETFGLRVSSVQSMLPFLRASGLLEEVGRGIFQATSASRAWIESDDDLNFIRILHANMRFVGEMIQCAEIDVTRDEIYAMGSTFGLNIDKCRWIAQFLLDTDLIEESGYGRLRATRRGVLLLGDLPLAETEAEADSADTASAIPVTHVEGPGIKESRFGQDLAELARDPMAQGQSSGRAFENRVGEAFTYMGFDSRVISGSGDTDVLVRWQHADGSQRTAIVEAKSRSNGHVAHTDISDVAILTHKERHGAEFVAIIGPAFSGETIKNMATQRSWVLLEADRLGDIADNCAKLGLRPHEMSILFEAPNGLSRLNDLIAQKKRELDIVSFLLYKLAVQKDEAGGALSSVQISHDGRRTELAPSTEEVVVAIQSLTQPLVEALNLLDASSEPRFDGYILGDATAAARRLRALADAIERKPGSGRVH